MVSRSTVHALDEIHRRQQDVAHAFTSGAVAAADDVRKAPDTRASIDPMTAAAPAGAYFVGSDARGRQTYTRAGSFRLRDNAVVDGTGNVLLGYASAHAGLGPLRADPLDVALGRTADLVLGADGTISYQRNAVDPKTGARTPAHVVIGRVALARFPAATRLQPVDATHVIGPAGSIPHIGRPGDSNFGALAAHREEQSQVDLNAGIERLQEAYIAFDALRAVHGAHGKLEKAAMDLVK
ncbi:MAG: hypothetical protein NVS1B14_04950 [Vulcanimicrobiaceae bacterium]